MSYLSRDAILNIEDLDYEDVEVPEWGGTVRVRGLTGSERDSYEASVMQRRGKRYELVMADARAKLVALVVVNEEGARLFSDRDVKALGRKSAAALNRVFSVGQRLSGLTNEDIEELTENLEPGQNGDSSSS